MGICNSPEIFQDKMNGMFRGVTYTHWQPFIFLLSPWENNSTYISSLVAKAYIIIALLNSSDVAY